MNPLRLEGNTTGTVLIRVPEGFVARVLSVIAGVAVGGEEEQGYVVLQQDSGAIAQVFTSAIASSDVVAYSFSIGAPTTQNLTAATVAGTGNAVLITQVCAPLPNIEIGFDFKVKVGSTSGTIGAWFVWYELKKAVK